MWFLALSGRNVRKSSILTPTGSVVMSTLNLVSDPMNLTRALSDAESANLEHSSRTTHQTSSSDQPRQETFADHFSNMLFSREPIRKSYPTDSGQSTVAYQQHALSAPSISLQSTRFSRGAVSVVRLCMHDGQDFRPTGWC